MSQDKERFRGRRGQGNTYNKNTSKVNVGDTGKEVLESLNDNHPIIKQFQEYAALLDAKHDKHERIVKISRDITIESKRVIFLLHSIDRESKRDAVLEEAEKRLNVLVEVMFKKIALELDGEDPYVYLRAYRAGFQEFIEALTFLWYLKDKSLHGWLKVAESMVYTVSNPSQSECDKKSDNPATEKNDDPATAKKNDYSNIQKTKDNPDVQKSDDNADTVTSHDNPDVQKSNDHADTETSQDNPSGQEVKVIPSSQKQVKVLVAPMEYVLGVADLTGELMRKCISNLGTGDISSCFETCNFVRQMYTQFLGCGRCGKEVSRKLSTLRQSLTKMENVCYTIKIRGSEVPKHMLVDVAMRASDDAPLDDDEGYQVY